MEIMTSTLPNKYNATSLDSVSAANTCEKKSISIPSDDEIGTYTENHSAYQTAEQLSLAKLCINTIRFLCVDAINNANSGHPGICMGMAAAVFVLFDKHLKFNPMNPSWRNRDRFILSAGHGSMLLYALLHLCGYESVSIEDIKKFRKLHSRTPGHPECTETPGVEVCTGPLGQGICNAVGMAIAEAHQAAIYNRSNCSVIDNYTYCIVGDGCMMEGMAGEACSLAGHLKLDKLIVLYDDNHISIDGSTDLAFTEDVSKRFESYGWQVLHVANGTTDVIGIDEAIKAAKSCVDKPSMIKITTTIGYGAPNLQNSAKVHGSALGKSETDEARKTLGYEYEPFELPLPAVEHFRRKITTGESLEKEWHQTCARLKRLHPDVFKMYEQTQNSTLSSAVELNLRETAEQYRNKSQATRKHSKVMLNIIAPLMPNLIGGAADTSPSTLTDLECSQDFTASNRKGRNIRFGVREHAMAAIANGIQLSGYSMRAFCSTFLVFSDYMRGAMRMASLSRTGTIFITTHDSIGLGEDGPSHQPIEHLTSLRAMPNHDVWRPADAIETAASYASALATNDRPSTIVLSRQTVSTLEHSDFDGARRGGYVLPLGDMTKEADGTIIATGSEVGIAVEAAEELRRQGWRVRVVSLPCWEEFERQEGSYRRRVLGSRESCLVVEAGCRMGWERYAEWFVCVDEFGMSGKGADVMECMGVSKSNVEKRFLEMVRAKEC